MRLLLSDIHSVSFKRNLDKSRKNRKVYKNTHTRNKKINSYKITIKHHRQINNTVNTTKKKNKKHNKKLMKQKYIKMNKKNIYKNIKHKNDT